MDPTSSSTSSTSSISYSSSLTSPSSLSPSIVARAKTALHSAAAKAEKVLTDIKSDRKNDRGEGDVDGKPPRKQTERSLVGADASVKLQEDDPEKGFTEEEDISDPKMAIIPPASTIKQLAMAIESGKKFMTMKDILASVRDSSPVKERAGLSFSVVKSIVLREKEENVTSEFSGQEEVPALIHLLFHSVGQYPKWRCGGSSSSLAYSPRDIHGGAPPESFVVRLSEIIGSFKSLWKMASFWTDIVSELRGLWSQGQPIPYMPLDEKPDLNSCLLHQQLQVINCCIARKTRRIIAIESLDSLLSQSISDNKFSVDFPDKLHPYTTIYAKVNSSDQVLRLGAVRPSKNLTMLETGEAIYSPVTQEGPVLTEALIRETEEFVLRTGSVGHGCSQLLSDMQAFKAANPGCILEDFIRWHSPPDWKEMKSVAPNNDSSDGGDLSSKGGRLSQRMQKEGNLWRELWETAIPLPAVKQAPLFDEDLAVESTLATLEDVQPSELFRQLFICLLCTGFIIAEAALSMDKNFSKLFYDCKDYVMGKCQSNISNDNIDDLCKVYETLETIMIHPEEAILSLKQSEETNSEEPRSRIKKISLGFLGKDMQSSRKMSPEDQKNSDDKHKTTLENQKKPDEKNINMFSNLFDGKTSLFSRRHSKSNNSQSESSSPDESDWTIL